MKTLKQIMKYKSNALDGRDLDRLIDFIPEKDLKKFDIELKDGFVGTHDHIPLTKATVLKRLEDDLGFAFQKALDQRGISSSMMHDVISMWNWVLEEGLEDFDDYAQYGLPLYKTTALLYGFDNPIGHDVGNEDKYAS